MSKNNFIVFNSVTAVTQRTVGVAGLYNVSQAYFLRCDVPYDDELERFSNLYNKIAYVGSHLCVRPRNDT